MHQLSEDALRCWVDTIEEASRLQESLRHEIKGSVHCLYWFLGKDPLTLLASSSPTSTNLTGETPDQTAIAPDTKKKRRSKPQIKKRNRRAKHFSPSCTFQTTLRQFGFKAGADQCLSPSRSQVEANSQKTDYSGTWLLTTP